MIKNKTMPTRRRDFERLLNKFTPRREWCIETGLRCDHTNRCALLSYFENNRWVINVLRIEARTERQALKILYKTIWYDWKDLKELKLVRRA